MDGMEETSDYSSYDEEGYNNSETEEVVPMSMGDIFESFYRGIDDIFERLQANMERHESAAQSLLYQLQLVDEQIKIEQANADDKKDDLFKQLNSLKESIQDLMRNIQDSTMDGGDMFPRGQQHHHQKETASEVNESV